MRQFIIEMESVIPYLEALERSEDGDSRKLRNKLAAKFFGNLPPLEGGPQTKELHLSDSVIDRITKRLAKIIKKYNHVSAPIR